MKSTMKCLVIALAAVIGFSFAVLSLTGCDGGGGGGGGDDNSVTYTSYDADGTEYKLEITKNTSKAAYKPKEGDSYKLTIKETNGTTKTSTGIVVEVSINGDDYTIELEHNATNNSVSVTVSGSNITFSDTIYLDDNSTRAKPGTLTTKKPSSGGGGNGLTITGLPSGQWNVLVFAAGTDISNYDAFDIISSMGSNKIEAANYGGNSGSFFPLVKVKVGGPTGPEDIWTGSGSRSVALNKGSTADYYWATVNFSNGNGTVQYSSFKPLGSGGEDPGTGDNPGTGSGTEADPITLTAGTWADGSITSSTSAVWYSFSVTSGQTYYVWWNDGYGSDGTKTLDVKVSAYYSSGTSIFTSIDSGWSSPRSFDASSSGTVKIKVEPYSSGNTGTFAVAYSTGSTRPGSSGGNPGRVVSLPDAGILAEYGLSGLSLPAGATVSYWIISTDDNVSRLTIAGACSPADDSAFNSYFTGNGWIVGEFYDTEGQSIYLYSKDGFDGLQYVRSTGYQFFSQKRGSEIVWPYSSILTECGLSGFPVQADITSIEWGYAKANNGINCTLRIHGESVNVSAITSCFISNGWILEENNGGEDSFIRAYSKPGFAAVYAWTGSACQIQIFER